MSLYQDATHYMLTLLHCTMRANCFFNADNESIWEMHEVTQSEERQGIMSRWIWKICGLMVIKVLSINYTDAMNYV